MSVWYNQTTFLPNVVHCYSRAALSILTKTVGFFKKSGYMIEKEKIIVAAAVTNCPDGVSILGDDLCGFFIEKKYLGEDWVLVGDEVTVILFDNIVAAAFIKNQMDFMKTFDEIVMDKEDENPDALFDELPALLRHRFCMLLHQVPEHLREIEKQRVLSGYAMFMLKNRAGACCNELRGLGQKPYIFISLPDKLPQLCAMTTKKWASLIRQRTI